MRNIAQSKARGSARGLSVDKSLSGSELMLQNKLILCDNLPKRMIETKEKEADRMVAEDTLMYKQGVMDEKVDMIRSLRDENFSISALAKASKLSEDEVLRILSEE